MEVDSKLNIYHVHNNSHVPTVCHIIHKGILLLNLWQKYFKIL